jgi:hypothetical protein
VGAKEKMNSMGQAVPELPVAMSNAHNSITEMQNQQLARGTQGSNRLTTFVINKTLETGGTPGEPTAEGGCAPNQSA